MYRAQILLANGQYQSLRRIAQGAGRSVSDVVREMLGQAIARYDEEEEARRRPRLAALEAIAAERRTILERRSGRPLAVDGLLSDLRDERDGDLLEGLGRGR